MIKHTVAFRFAESVGPERVKAVLDELATFPRPD